MGKIILQCIPQRGIHVFVEKLCEFAKDINMHSGFKSCDLHKGHSLIKKMEVKEFRETIPLSAGKIYIYPQIL